MPTCREMSRVISDGLDRDLPWPRRFRLRLHLLICTPCTRFQRQMLFLRRVVRDYLAARGETAPDSPAALSSAARERIKQLLEQGGA